MYFIGIDPGKRGGIVTLNGSGEIINSQLMPIIPAKRRKILGGMASKTDKKAEYDIQAIADLACKWAEWEKKNGLDIHVFLERQQPLGPMIGSAHSEFQIGWGYGIWTGVLALAVAFSRLKLTTVRIVDWQSTMLAGVEAKDSKERARIRVQQIWGEWRGMAKRFLIPPNGRVLHDGLCDAALIAEYGRQLSRAWLSRA